MKPPIPLSYTLETQRFRLRMPNEGDILAIFSATRYEGFNEGMVWDPPEKEEELFESLDRNTRNWESGTGYNFTVVKKGESKLLGRVTIRKTKEAGVWDIGYWTHPESQNQGVMTEALEAVLTFGFQELSASKIEACHALWNKASGKVLTKNGMKFIRYIEKGFQKRGEWVEENMLAITQEEWEKQ